MSTDFESLLLTKDGAWKEGPIRKLDEDDIVEWIYARLVGRQEDGFDRPGSRWNYEHPADVFFHLAGRLQEWRDYHIDYTEFSEVLYEASATFLEECNREEVGYRDVAAFCWQVASSATYVKDPDAAQDLVDRYRDLVLSEKFSWWHTDDLSWTKGITERSTDTEVELNIQNMLQRALIQLQAQVGERGYDPELVRHFEDYEARTKTYTDAFTGKLAFCGTVPVEGWLKSHKPFWHFYRMYAKEPDSWASRNLVRRIRQAYSFPYNTRDPEYHKEAVKCLAYELNRYNTTKLRRGWSADEVWKEIREGLEEDLSIYNHYDRRDQEPLSEDEFWPMTENLKDSPTF